MLMMKEWIYSANFYNGQSGSTANCYLLIKCNQEQVKLIAFICCWINCYFQLSGEYLFFNQLDDCEQKSLTYHAKREREKEINENWKEKKKGETN